MSGPRSSLADDAVRGAADGLVATAAMSAVMLVRQRAGAQGEQPPERIVEKGLDALGVDRDEQTENLLATLSHFAFGAVAGSVYRVLRGWLATPGPEVLYGLVYGLLVWAVSYQGWIPRLGILPPASRDRNDRQATMVAAHLVYGGVLSALRRQAKS